MTETDGPSSASLPGNQQMTTTSKNIDGVQELTLVATLKSGLVPCVGQTLSYASRLRLLFEALFAQRKLETEGALFEQGLLESLQVLRFVRWALLEDDTKLMLAVSFDGPWEPYIRKIVEGAGPMLDVIFCHCDDYAGNSCADGYPKFAAWVRAKQVDIPFIYAADADLTVDDVRYLKSFERAVAAGGSISALSPAVYPQSSRPLTRAYALFGLRALFPDVRDALGKYTDQAYFDIVSVLVMKPDFTNLAESAAVLQASGVKLSLREAALTGWVAGLIQNLTPALAKSKAPLALVPKEIALPETVQGNILTSYKGKGMTHGCFALVRFKSAEGGKRLLARLAPLVTCETPLGGADLPHVTFNLALTFEGLRTLGLTDEERALFPKEFQEGLEARAGLLGDVGWSHPENWALPEANWPIGVGNGDPLPLSVVDAVFILQTSEENVTGYGVSRTLANYLDKLELDSQGAEFEIMHVQATRRFGDKGHLGSFDGASQPVAVGEPIPERMAERDQVPLGELLLGYPNLRGELGALPDELRQNSTFMALRNMSQDPLIYDLLRSQGRLDLALGRNPEGANLIDGRESNDFEYGPDSDQKCPFFSHVRRANPRTPAPNAPPRIIRRGMSYGPKWTAGSTENAPGARGVMFLAFAASLADQYEVVQRWVNGGNSTGVLSAHPDLIAGTFRPGERRQLKYRTPGGDVDTITLPPKPAATLRWGLYAFVPSTSALQALAQHAPGKYKPPAPPSAVKPALAMQYGAPALSPVGARAAAKLEDMFRRDGIKARLTEVAMAGGIAREPEYAVLAVSRQHVATMLSSSDAYSVRSYWARMTACSATLYLGMDPKPKALPSDEYTTQVLQDSYENESTLANEFVRGIAFDKAFYAARAAANDWFKEQEGSFLQALKALKGRPREQQPEPVLDLQALSARVIRDVASSLYGIPKDLLSDDLDLQRPGATESRALRCPVDLTSVFAHVFPPRPTAAVSADAHARGISIKEKVMSWYADHDNDEAKAKSPLIQHVLAANKQTDDFIQRTIIGLLSGFAVPTNGSLISVLEQLVATDALWRLQRIMPGIAVDGVAHTQLFENLTPIMNQIYDLMINAPIPAMVHRTAMSGGNVGKVPGVCPGVDVNAGEIVALHLGAAASEAKLEQASDAWKFLFGDLPAKDQQALGTPVHACPGQHMAFGVIAGTVVALLGQKRLKKIPLDPLTLTKYLPEEPPSASLH
jgi:Dyp-type peroxidase family